MPQGRSITTELRLSNLVVLSIALAVMVFYLLGQGSDALYLFAHLGLIAFVGIAGMFGLVSFARLGKSKPGFASLGFGVGLILWMFGLVVYTYSYLITSVDLPYLSLADIFYLLSYLPIILGCFGMLWVIGPSLGRINWLLTAVTGVFLCLMVVVYGVIPSIETLDTPLEVLVTALYPLLDDLILVLLLPLFFAFRKSIFRTPYTLLAAGAFLIALGDLVFTYVNLTVGYYDGHPLDLLWFTGSIAYGYGFWRLHAGFNPRK